MRRRALQRYLSNPLGKTPKIVTKIGTSGQHDVSGYVSGIGNIRQSADFEPGVNRLSTLSIDLLDPTGFMSREHFYSLVQSKSAWGTEISVSLQYPSEDGSLGLFRGNIIKVDPDERTANAHIESDDFLAKIFDGELAPKQPEEDVVAESTNSGSAAIVEISKFPFTTENDCFEVEFTDHESFTVVSSRTHTSGSRVASSYDHTIGWFPGERIRWLRTLSGDPPVADGQAFNVQPGAGAKRVKLDEGDDATLREASLEEGKHFRVHHGRAFIERLLGVDLEEVWVVNYTTGGDTYTSDGQEVEFGFSETDGFFKAGDKFSFETQRIAWFGRQRSRITEFIGPTDVTVGVYEPRKFAANDFAYIGIETVTVVSIGSTFIEVTRGTYPKAYEKDAEIKNLTQSIETAYDILVDSTVGLLTNTDYGFGYATTSLDTTQWDLFSERTEHIKFEGSFEEKAGPAGVNEILRPTMASIRAKPNGLLFPNIHFPPAPPLDFVDFNLERDFSNAKQKEDPTRFFNSLTIKYGGDDLRNSITEDLTASVNLYGKQVAEEAKEFSVLQENQDAVVRDIARKMLHVSQDPLRILEGDLPLSGLLVEPGEYFCVQGDNFGRQGLRLRERSFRPRTRTVKIEADNDHLLDLPWCWIGTGNQNLHLRADVTSTGQTVIDLLQDWRGLELHEDAWDTMVGELLEVDTEILRVDSIDASLGRITATRAHTNTIASTHTMLQSETNFSVLATIGAYDKEIQLDNWGSLSTWGVLSIGMESMLVNRIDNVTGVVGVDRRYRGTRDGTPTILTNIGATTDTSIMVSVSGIFNVGDVCRVTDGATYEDMRIEAINAVNDIMEVTRGWHYSPIRQWSAGTSVYVKWFGYSQAQTVLQYRPVAIRTQAISWDIASTRERDYAYFGTDGIRTPLYYFF